MKSLFILLFVSMAMIVMPAASKKNNPPAKKPGHGSVLKAETFSGLQFRNIGPALASGRVSDVVMHPSDRATWYVAAGSGGVWKTSDAGTTWTPIFDRENSYSIGCIAVDASNPNTVWVGSGENVSGRHVGFGDGIYKSLDGGKTWKNMGLKNSEHIAKIIIDPHDSDVIYAAAEGGLWSPGAERGVFKSSDGGATWQAALQISKDTGVTDIAMDLQNPAVLYAAAYQRRRSVAAFIAGGPESGIYKTFDSGKHWQKLSSGLPQGHIGRIGLAVSPQKAGVVYATIEADDSERGFYRSTDSGASWEKRSKYISDGTGPHYYQEIYADPHRFDRVYQNDVWLNVTDDGGKTFREVEGKGKHSDNHALAFDPRNPDYLLAGCDGGLYESWNCGQTWRYFANLPLAQFYKVALDQALPFYNIHGGSQDNGSQTGPSRTINVNGIIAGDWYFTLGADGYACAIDPQDPNIIYASWQTGSLVRYDKKSGEEVGIQPQPEVDEAAQRWNWDSPLLISPHCSTRIYYGSQYLYRSDDRGDTWARISPDLSKSIFRLQQPIMGKTWSADALWDHDAMSYYGSLTSISESPLVEGLLYTGTDDGLIQISEDGGKSWRKIATLPGVPPFFFVNDIKASRYVADTVFVAVDSHKSGDFKPYLLKSFDRGKTWTSISGDLPDRHLVWSLEQDPLKADLLFAGTEFGIFFTLDGGSHWIKFSGGLPTIPFRDIEVQAREADLVGASFGRGIFVLDDYSLLRKIDSKILDQEAVLFPVKKALSYIQRRPLNLNGKGFQGDDYYLAPNPPFGAVFSYFLKEPLRSGKAERREEEKQLEKQGKSIPFPGWDALRREDREEEPAIIITVRDVDGNVVRRLNGPIDKGIQRVAWDLCYPDLEPTRLQEETSRYPWDYPIRGPLVVPGTFSVSLAKRVDGVITPLGEPQSFIVEALQLSALAAPERREILAFQKKAGELQRAMYGADEALSEALNRMQFIKKAIQDAPAADLAWGDEAREMEKQLQRFKTELVWDRTLGKRSEPQLPPLLQRVDAQLGSTAAITCTRKHNYELAASAFAKLLEKIRQVIDVELLKLEEKMEAAGLPWTPGRKVPRWKKNQ
jgi:photosystem II stability/assembly factor-like uncharacterized protein